MIDNALQEEGQEVQEKRRSLTLRYTIRKINKKYAIYSNITGKRVSQLFDTKKKAEKQLSTGILVEVPEESIRKK